MCWSVLKCVGGENKHKVEVWRSWESWESVGSGSGSDDITYITYMSGYKHRRKINNYSDKPKLLPIVLYFIPYAALFVSYD